MLTDAEFFGGSPDDLAAARAAAPDLPILRKDFTVDGRDVADARAMGADAVLLIVAALSPGDLSRLRGLADGLGLAAVVEVHDEDELAHRPQGRRRPSSASTSATCARSRSTPPGPPAWPPSSPTVS